MNFTDNMAKKRGSLCCITATFLAILTFVSPALAQESHLSKKDIARLMTGAQKGDAAAQTGLGAAYLYGWGIEKNESEAVVWLRKAAEQGQPLAQFDMGEICLNGIGGVAKDENEAVKWFIKSAAQGNAFSQYNLAQAYHIGFGGVPKDDVQAYMWIGLAAAHETDDRILKARTEFASSMTADQIAQAKQLIRQWKQQSSK